MLRGNPLRLIVIAALAAAVGTTGMPAQPAFAQDTDGDGCTDAQELGPDPALGGGRDPLNPYDFYDITDLTMVVGTKDKVVCGFDLDLLLAWGNAATGAGPNPNGLDYDVDGNPETPLTPAVPPNTIADGLEIDFVSFAGPTGPDGAISSFDVISLLAQMGDSCLQDSDGDYMPDDYEDAHVCLDKNVADDGADPDSDWLTNLEEYEGADADLCTPDDTDPCVNDTDADGCADGEELGADPSLGGGRDPLNPYDFYDVPAPPIDTAYPSPPGPGSTKNQVVFGEDLSALLWYGGVEAGGGPNNNGADYDDDKNENGIPDGEEYDKADGTPVPAPNGVVFGEDLSSVLGQGGDSCEGPPP